MRPDEELARRVAEKLAEAGVVPPRDVEALAARLAQGEMKARDWEALVLAERDGDA